MSTGGGARSKTVRMVLRKAGQPPKINANNEEQAEELFQDKLRKVVGVVRNAAQTRDQLPSHEWAHIIDQADATITALCKQMASEDYAEEVGLFGTKGDSVIRTKKWELGAGMTNSIQSFMKILLRNKITDEDEEKFYNENMPPSWPLTYRPSLQHSNFLSRLSPEYDHEKLDQVVISFPLESDMHDKFLAVAEARFNMECLNSCDPIAIALGEDTLVVIGVGGKEGIIERFPIHGQPSEPATPQGDSARPSSPYQKRTKIGPSSNETPSSVHIDSNVAWVAEHSRIRAFELGQNDQKMIHLLGSKGYGEAFGLCDEVLFRFGSGGKLAFWNRAALAAQAPEAVTLRAKATPPTSTLQLAGVIGHPFVVAPLYGTSNFVFSLDADRNGRFGVKIFDIAHPTQASTIGIGVGLSAWNIATHKAYPGTYITAGGDSFTRVWDYRHPLPQLTLDGHTKEVTACTIASFGISVPIIFTGAKDELLKAWDIRNTKTCLYDLSTGCTVVEDMAWHERTNSLYAVGSCPWEDPYRSEFGRVPEDRDHRRVVQEFFPDDEDAPAREEGDGIPEANHWPKLSNLGPYYFGKRWCVPRTSLLEYHFNAGALAHQFPVWRPY